MLDAADRLQCDQFKRCLRGQGQQAVLDFGKWYGSPILDVADMPCKVNTQDMDQPRHISTLPKLPQAPAAGLHSMPFTSASGWHSGGSFMRGDLLTAMRYWQPGVCSYCTH